MEALPLPEEKRQLYYLINEQRQFVIDENTGNVVRRDAWLEIDRLLDALSELNALEVEVQYEDT